MTITDSDGHSWTSEMVELRFSCSIQRDTFKSGERVEASINLEAENKTDIGYLRLWFPETELRGYGYRVSRNGKGILPKESWVSPHPPSSWGGSCPGAIKVTASAPYHLTVPLSEMFELSQPGSYTLTILCPPPMGTAYYPESYSTTFTVVRD